MKTRLRSVGHELTPGRLGVSGSLVGCLFVSLACASVGWDGVVDVAVSAVDAPEAGRPFRITSAVDRRAFSKVANALRTPSLLDEGDGRDPSRAVGRRRGTRGGNLWLAQGRTVQSLAAEATAAAFGRAGYREASENEVEEGEVLGIEVEVLAFWTWVRQLDFTPDRVQSEVVLRVQAPLGALAEGVVVCGKSQRSTPVPSGPTWSATVSAALEDLIVDLATVLDAPGRPPPAWRCQPAASGPQTSAPRT